MGMFPLTARMDVNHMKKQITVVLEVESDDEFMMTDEFMENWEIEKKKPCKATTCEECEQFRLSEHKEPICSMYCLILKDVDNPYCKRDD